MLSRAVLVLFMLVGSNPMAFSDADTFYNCRPVEGISPQDLSVINAQPMKVDTVIETLPAESFNVSRYQGKTLVFLISATWCGYCKFDILKTMEWRAKEEWPKEDIAIVHMVVSSGRQDLIKAQQFVNNPTMGETPLSLDGIDYYYSEEANFDDFKAMTSSSGDLLFPELRGTPYAIIFDQNGVARFRGHYTNRNEDHSAYYDEHYQFIGEVASSRCEAN